MCSSSQEPLRVDKVARTARLTTRKVARPIKRLTHLSKLFQRCCVVLSPCNLFLFRRKLTVKRSNDHRQALVAAHLFVGKRIEPAEIFLFFRDA